MIDEIGLIERAARGEERAFRVLYDRHVGSLYRFLRQYSDDASQVEEWVQRAFIKAFQGIGAFERASRFSSWLFSIGLNEMRTDKRRTPLVAFDSRALDAWEGPAEEPGDFLWVEAMKRSIRELDESKRTVFLLFEVEGYSHAEIASMLGIGEGTSRAMLSRAKQWLRRQLITQETTP